jgi:hypothetical protein
MSKDILRRRRFYGSGPPEIQPAVLRVSNATRCQSLRLATWQYFQIGQMYGRTRAKSIAGISLAGSETFRGD